MSKPLPKYVQDKSGVILETKLIEQAGHTFEAARNTVLQGGGTEDAAFVYGITQVMVFTFLTMAQANPQGRPMN